MSPAGNRPARVAWLLDTSHWKCARAVRLRLVEAAEWPEDRGRDIVRTCLESFRCKQRAGNGKVDLLVASEMENERRPILVMEPKADNVAGEDQLSHMSAGPEQMPGLVFFLGDSAMRDDGVLEKRGIFGRITVFDILDAWRELGLPKSGKDWPKRIRPGRKRLKFAFELDQGKREKYREYGYRNPKHFLRFCIRSGAYERRKLGSLELYPSQHRSEIKERRQILLVADHGKPPNITGNSSTEAGFDLQR